MVHRTRPRRNISALKHKEKTMNERKVIEKARAYRLAHQMWKLSFEGTDHEKTRTLFKELEDRENELLEAITEE